jgi:LPXTG-motif cell wall-anchored protein
VHVPGESESAPFWMIIGGMVLLLLGMVAYFRRRGFL